MEIRAVVPTDAGLHSVWDPAAFVSVVDYETWEPELLEEADVARHIKAGHPVPINIGSDGAFAITVRFDHVAVPSLTADEQRRVVVSSEPYRFSSSGQLAVSGIEYVAGRFDHGVSSMEIAPGENGPDQPDFVVLVGPMVATSFRTSFETFERNG